MQSSKSFFDYCPLHDSVAMNPELFDLALKGRLTPLMKEFALEVERGIYPKHIM